MIAKIDCGECSTISTRNHFLFLSTLAGASLVAVATATAQSSRFDDLSNLPFEQNRPTKQTAQTLKDELLFQCACNFGILEECV
ncbi:hypothetical protein H8A97_04960 [Bradyrhizobium sp. Arg62]|uniref:hypothetical protein n=1 Tax=Bradyrhizobium brasilense TaxID=1419277 RepID=UPI001E5A563C|nr:hypothetical protein [Bradyrhizobium brasilense]MCC8944474.1 hypothetical protein [Bradyrhizobium brasilense]